jgi:hypothetical protein
MRQSGVLLPLGCSRIDPRMAGDSYFLVSLCSRCVRQDLQYFLILNLSASFFLFFMVV